MNEIKWFRLLLFVLALLLIPGWGVSTYHYSEAQRLDQLAQEAHESSERRLQECYRSITASCQTYAPTIVVYSFSNAEPYKELAKTWFVYSTGIAVVLIILFYGVRWAMTGRLRPLWPLSTGETPEK